MKNPTALRKHLTKSGYMGIEGWLRFGRKILEQNYVQGKESFFSCFLPSLPPRLPSNQPSQTRQPSLGWRLAQQGDPGEPELEQGAPSPFLVNHSKQSAPPACLSWCHPQMQFARCPIVSFGRRQPPPPFPTTVGSAEPPV